MLPYIHLFTWSLPSYWLLSLIGILVATVVIAIRNRRFHLPSEDILHTALFGWIGAIIGAKILYFITILPLMLKNITILTTTPENVITLLAAGNVFYGGLLGGLAGAGYYLRRYQLNAGLYAELFAPAIPLFHGFGRIGCFLAGCCYGIPHASGIVYHHALSAPNGIALLPIQLIEAGCNLFIFGAIILSEKRRPPGFNLLIYLISYSICRFILEFFRGDAIRGQLGSLSTSQWISLVILVVAILGTIKKSRRQSAEKKE